MSNNKNTFWFPDNLPELKDPSREACIIYLDKNGNEEYREYFGNNARIEYKI